MNKKSLKAIGGDSTNINIGCRGSAMHWVEVYTNHLCKLTTAEIKKFIDKPQWPRHAQSIERCVKQVTEAANRVCKHEK
ncbi:hypothetical protein E2320_001867, partial [Naja naja]